MNLQSGGLPLPFCFAPLPSLTELQTCSVLVLGEIPIVWTVSTSKRKPTELSRHLWMEGVIHYGDLPDQVMSQVNLLWLFKPTRIKCHTPCIYFVNA